MPPLPATPRRRGRPPKARPVEASATAADPASSTPPEGGEGPAHDGDAGASGARTRPRQPTERVSRADALTIEAIVAVEPARDFRLHPRDRVVAFTAEVGRCSTAHDDVAAGRAADADHGRREVLVRSAVVARRSSPRLRPGRRRVGRRGRWLAPDPGDRPSGRRSLPRWSPDGRRLGFVSRRRGWSQVWVVDAPVPRRGRPPREPRQPEPQAITGSGVDVETYEWSPDGTRIVALSFPAEDLDRQPRPRRRCRRRAWPPRVGDRDVGGRRVLGRTTPTCSSSPMPTAGSRSSGSVRTAGIGRS